jgi:outer membrane protein TolC
MVVASVAMFPRWTRHRGLGRVLALLALSLPTVASAEKPLTLEDAVSLALTNNERALKAPLRVEVATGQLERARAAFLPTLAASGTETLNAKADRGGRHFANAESLNVTQPLLNLSAFPLYAQARHQLRSEQWGSVEDRRTVAFDAARTFLNALASERLLEAAQRRLDRAHATQQDTQARVDAQLASTNDATRVAIDTATADSQVNQARGNVERAYLELSFLLGRSTTGPLVAPERTTSAARTGAIHREDVVRIAESRRPDLRSAEERTEALRQSAKEPLYRLAPTVALVGQVRTIVDPLPTETGFSEAALLTLSWTIYDAGARYADRRTRLAQADSQALDERQLRRSIATDISVAISALRTARKNYLISEDAALTAQRNTEETEILYRQGLARAIEVTDANASRYAAEVAVESAKLAMEQAYLGLRQALGLDPIGESLTFRAPASKESR